jgi:ABC-type branched-subunit amino acid transport system substrate-binding protein
VRRALAAVACLVTLTACGSQVPPSEVLGSALSSTAAAGNAALDVGAGNGGGAGGAGASVAAGPSLAAGGGGTAAAGVRPGGSGGSGSRSGGGGGGGGGSTGNGGGTQQSGASCAGFQNATGITDSTITIANADDISGPVPGLFKSAQQAVEAYAAYFNATSSICGRKLSVEPLDSGTSDSGDQQAATTACGNSFAMVGSMAAFDSGGASTVASCGIPDLRAANTTTGRVNSPVSFGVYSLRVSEVPLDPWNFFKGAKFGDAYKHAGMIYLDAGAASLNAASFVKGMQMDGYTVVMNEPMQVTNPSYDNLVAEMKQKGVKLITFVGADTPYATTLMAKMTAQNVQAIFTMDPTAYEPGFANSDGTNGAYIYVPGPLFEQASSNPELQLYLQWLSRTAPNAVPTFFGVYAWAAARLFTQEALALGGKLTRANLLAAVRGIHAYTDNGMFKPTDVGGKHSPPCQNMVLLQNHKWIPQTGYVCGPVANTG